MRLPQDRILHIDTEIKDGKVNVVAEWQGELVRCKDCRWWNGSQETMHNNHLCRNWSNFGSINTSADDFCSYGERREDDEA